MMNRSRNPLCATLARALVVASLISTRASALVDPANWVGGNGNWSTPSWVMPLELISLFEGDLPALYPDNVLWGGEFNVMTSYGGSGSRLTLEIPVTVSLMSVFDSDEFIVEGPAGRLTLDSGIFLDGLLNDGVVKIEDGGWIGTSYGAMLAFEGGGQIILNNGSMGTSLGITRLSSGQDLYGHGKVTGTEIQANGHVEANVAGESLKLEGNVVNDGRLSATNGGLLKVEEGSLENHEWVDALAASQAWFQDNDVTNEAWMRTESGLLGFNDGSLENKANASIEADLNGRLTFNEFAITNRSDIAARRGSRMDFTHTVMDGAGGSLVLSGNSRIDLAGNNGWTDGAYHLDGTSSLEVTGGSSIIAARYGLDTLGQFNVRNEGSLAFDLGNGPHLLRGDYTAWDNSVLQVSQGGLGDVHFRARDASHLAIGDTALNATDVDLEHNATAELTKNAWLYASLDASGSTFAALNNNTGTDSYFTATGDAVLQFDDGEYVRSDFNGSGNGVFRNVGRFLDLTDPQLSGTFEHGAADAAAPYFQVNLAGEFRNNGVVDVQGFGKQAIFHLRDTTTFSGSGRTNLHDNGYDFFSIPYMHGAKTVINRGHTFAGAGFIGGTVKLTNEEGGVITADRSGEWFKVTAPIVNRSALRAENGGRLITTNTLTQSVDGTISALDGSTVQATGKIEGGILSTEGSGEIHNTGSLALVPNGEDSLVNRGDFRAGNPDAETNTSIRGILVNEGQMEFLDSGKPNRITVAVGGATLAGGGTVTLNHPSQNEFGVPYAAGAQLLTNLDNTIEGAATFGSVQLDNHHLVTANQNGRTLRFNSRVTNRSTMRAENGGTLRLSALTVQQPGGAIEALDGSLVDATSEIRGGTLRTQGSGVIRNSANLGLSPNGADSLVNEGRFESGNPSRETTTSFSGNLINQGSFEVLDTGHINYLSLGAGATLSGGGTLTLNDPTLHQMITPYAVGVRLLTNVDNTIEGAGKFTGNAQLLNQHLVTANQAGRALNFASAVTNEGVMRAEDGGVLQLFHKVTNADSGVVEALDDSRVELSGTFEGGRFRGVDTGVVRVIRGTSIRNLATDGLVEVGNPEAPVDFTLGINGTIANSGVIHVTDLGKLVYLTMSGDMTFTGGGMLVLSDSGRQQFNTAYAHGAHVLTNRDHTIAGSGQFTGHAHLHNEGIVDANLSGKAMRLGGKIERAGVLRASDGGILEVQVALTMDEAGDRLEARTGGRVTLGNPFTNRAGSVSVGDGSTVVTTGSSFTNEAELAIDRGGLLEIVGRPLVQTSGVTRHEGSITAIEGVSIQGGRLEGTGSVYGNLTNNGTFAPALATTPFLMNADFTQTPAGATEVVMTADGVSRFMVFGSANLDGALHVVAGEGFVPVPGQEFQILFSPRVRGSFSHVVPVNFPDGLGVKLTYTGTQVKGQVVGANAAPTLDPIDDVFAKLGTASLVVPLSGISAGEGAQSVTSVSARVIASTDTSLVRELLVHYTRGEPTATLTIDLDPTVLARATVEVTVQDDGGTENGGSDTLSRSFSMVVFGGFDHWMARQFEGLDTTGLDLSMAGDPDGDGLSNLLEYAFNSDPAHGDRRASLIEFGLAELEGVEHLYVAYPQRTDDPYLSYTVEVATAPGTQFWQSGPGHTLELAPEDVLAAPMIKAMVCAAEARTERPFQFLRVDVGYQE